MKNQSGVDDATRSSGKGNSTLAYLMVGAGIGAAMSLLLAPKSGTETRQWLVNKCLDSVDTANKSVRQTRGKVKVVMDHGQKKLSDAVEAARESIGKS